MALPPPEGATATGPDIIDTNVHLFQWPFRRLKYDRTEALVRKLRRHRIAQAWAGSFESVFHKQLDAANRRLVDECREHGGGLLIPIGSVNPVWPDWEEDLRRCHEQYQMRGVRLRAGGEAASDHLHSHLDDRGRESAAGPAAETFAGEVDALMDVALLADRFPNVALICGHSGGDWELAVRAVRAQAASLSNSAARIRTQVSSTTRWPR